MAVPGVCSSSSCEGASPGSPSSGRLYKHARLTRKIRREQGKRQQSLCCKGRGLWHQVTGCSSQVGFRLLSTPCLSGSVPPLHEPRGHKEEGRGVGHKGPSKDTVGANLHSLQRSSAVHDCKYLGPSKSRFLPRPLFLPVHHLLSLRLSTPPACSPCC